MKLPDHREKTSNLRLKQVLRFSLILLLVLLFFLIPDAFRHPDTLYQPNPREATFFFLDAGQANSTLIETPDGVILIDSGTASGGDALIAFLKTYRIDRIEYLFLTHADEDHAGGLERVLTECTVQRLLLCEFAYTELKSQPNFDRLSLSIEQANTELILLQAGDELPLGTDNASFSVLAPSKGTLSHDSNDQSLVLSFRFGNTTALFPGDLEEDGEKLLLSQVEKDLLSADLLLVPHHGSISSSSEPFLSAVSPAFAVISCGLDNPYGHPSVTVIERLQKIGTEVHRTDLEGTVIFVSDGKVFRREK